MDFDLIQEYIDPKGLWMAVELISDVMNDSIWPLNNSTQSKSIGWKNF